MRGKAIISPLSSQAGRITPAHAGKRRGCMRGTTAREDHPRPCGEKERAGVLYVFTRGSPPPMRGKEAEKAAQDTAGRITPAHAGKSFRQKSRCGMRTDHPRPCGEKGAH